jgi:hypothetical protein
MSARLLVPSPVPPLLTPDPFVRVEYLDFQTLAEHREFRFRVCRPGGSTEFRLRIAIVAFGATVRLQDGPDVCYQRLLRAVADGATAGPDVITLDDVDLASYRAAHTHVPKRRSSSLSSQPTPAVVPRRQPRMPVPRLPVAPLVSNDAEPVFETGQRVSHAVFGAGVTATSRPGHTVVRFDEDGARTFVTSMLKVDVLSAPHTWETGPGGHNRPCRTR